MANRLNSVSFVAICRRHSFEPKALADHVAVSMAMEYMAGERTFEEAAAVVDGLYHPMLEAAPDAHRAQRVCAAFDAGQYPLSEDGAWNEEKTRRLLAVEGIVA